MAMASTLSLKTAYSPNTDYETHLSRHRHIDRRTAIKVRVPGLHILRPARQTPAGIGDDRDRGRRLLIDCGPDFREQMLRTGSPDLDALLLTHIHYDHVGGIDDLRPWCRDGHHFPIHCTPDVERDLRTRLPYCFAEHPYPVRHSPCSPSTRTSHFSPPASA